MNSIPIKEKRKNIFINNKINNIITPSSNIKNEKRKRKKKLYYEINEERINYIKNSKLDNTPKKQNINLKLNINDKVNNKKLLINNRINSYKNVNNFCCKCLCHKDNVSQSNILYTNDKLKKSKKKLNNSQIISSTKDLNHIENSNYSKNNSNKKGFYQDNINLKNEKNEFKDLNIVSSNKKNDEETKEENYNNMNNNIIFKGNKKLQLRAKKLREKVNKLNLKKMYYNEEENNNLKSENSKEKEFIIEENNNLISNNLEENKKTLSFKTDDSKKNIIEISNNYLIINKNKEKNNFENKNNNENDNNENNLTPSQIKKYFKTHNENISPIIENNKINESKTNENFFSDNENNENQLLNNIESPIRENKKKKNFIFNSYKKEIEKFDTNCVNLKKNIKGRNNSLPNKKNRILQSLKEQKDIENFCNEFKIFDKEIKHKKINKSNSQKYYINKSDNFNDKEDSFYNSKNNETKSKLKKLLELIPQHYGNNNIKDEKLKLICFINKTNKITSLSQVYPKYLSEKKNKLFNQYNNFNKSIMPPNKYDFIDTSEFSYF